MDWKMTEEGVSRSGKPPAKKPRPASGATVSPALGGWLGIGFIKGGHQAWEGKNVVIADPVRGSEVKARVASPHQYDPKGERMHG